MGNITRNNFGGRIINNGNNTFSGITTGNQDITGYFSFPTSPEVIGYNFPQLKPSNGLYSISAGTGSDLMFVPFSSSTPSLTNVTSIIFNTTATTTHTEGQIHWNSDYKTLEIDTENSDVQIEVGQQSVVRVSNQTGSVLTKGTAVYINGEQGQRPTITKADFSADTTSASVIGLVIDDINNGNNGYVLTFGLLYDINTIAYSAGTSLYLSSGGTISSTKPIAPKHDVRIGNVIVSNATTGSIFVNVQNGYELEELHDVRITGVTNGDLIVYSSGDTLWHNTKTLNGDYDVNGSLTADTIYLQTITTGVTHANIGRTAAGKLVQVGNSSQEIFVYSFSNAADNFDFYNDGLVRFGWDAPGNDLEFYMDTEPSGASDLRALATINYGIQQNSFITTAGILYDLYGSGVPAGSQLVVIIVPETDSTYPMYEVSLYNASSNVTVKITKTKKI